MINPWTISQLSVLTAGDFHDLSDWNELVDMAPVSDVYYRPGYARANEAAGHGKAIALVLASNHVRVLVPLLLRPLSDLPFAQDEPGFDAVTPYGYGGLLPLSEIDPLAETNVDALLDTLRQWCRDSGVVSCHIRLHPLLEQDQWLGASRFQNQTASLCFRALTTGIDLTRWDTSGQRIAGMSDSLRGKLNRARRRLHILVSESGTPMAEALRLFRQIYEYRISQLNAGPFYYFPKGYYTCLTEGTKLAVALAWLDDELVGGGLYLADRQFAHYHLGGTNENGFKFHSSTLLTNAGAQWARERGCRVLHLGGGSDGLWRYKKSYGGPLYRFYTLDVIADQSRYRNLLDRRAIATALPPPRQGFFPQYRA